MQNQLELVAVQLGPDSPTVLAWARDNARRPKTRWGIRIATQGCTGCIAGWERATFNSYSEARKAIEFILEKNGSYDQWRKK